MRLRDISISALLAIGLVAPAQVAGAADATPPVSGGASTTVVPETVSARFDGFESAPGFRAASAGGGELSSPAKAPIPFSMIGLELPEEAEARLRTSTDGVSWGDWQQTEHFEADDGPDLGSAEEQTAGTRAERFTEPLWVGEARFVQLEVDGAPLADVAATFIDSNGLSPSAGTIEVAPSEPTYHAASARPAIMTRAQWGANESYRSGSSSIASGGVKYSVVHHTAGGNSYSAAEGPAVVRGIYSYHTRTLGWSDVGYNVMVDKYGKIYEGRAGGLEKAVVGAHAQGFNTGSFGISVLGNYDGVAPSEAALNAVATTISWKFRLHGVSPTAKLTVRSGGSNKYPSGTSVTLDTITAHRNVGLTACPGAVFYTRMPLLRDKVLWIYNASAPAAAPAPAPAPTPAPTPAPPSNGGFSDIAGSVHAANIVKLVEHGITEGCEKGKFCPLADVTRGQAAAFLVRARPDLPLRSGVRFSDVPLGHPFVNHIAMATDAGLINGYKDGTFRPWEPITREQLATVLGRAANLSRRPGQFFNDVPWVSPHLAWVNALGEAGISQGCGGGSYCPSAYVTRQEMASFIARALLD